MAYFPELPCSSPGSRPTPWQTVGLVGGADAPPPRALIYLSSYPKAAPLRGLPWANGLAPRRWAGLEDSARLRLAPHTQIAIYRVFRDTKFVNQRVPNLWDTYEVPRDKTQRALYNTAAKAYTGRGEGTRTKLLCKRHELLGMFCTSRTRRGAVAGGTKRAS